MKVARIVVGACGFIGTRLCARLLADGGELLAIDTAPAPDDHPATVLTTRASHQHLHSLFAAHLRDADRAELYHTAGMTPPLTHLADTSPDQFSVQVDGNLTAAYTALTAFAEAATHLDVPAAAVVLSSVGAHRAHRYLVAYDAAKAGLESVVRSLAVECGPHLAIRAVAVGPIAQSATTAADGDLADDLVALVPAERYLDVDDVTSAVAAFGRPAFDGASGQTLIVDGGLTVQLRPRRIERAPEVPG